MAEVTVERLAVRVKDGSALLEAGPMGPAGVHVVELRNGTRMEVDAAELGRLVSIECAGNDLPEHFDDILPTSMAAGVREALGNTRPGDSVRVVESPNRLTTSTRRSSARGGEAAFAGAMAAVSALDDPDRSDAARAAAFLDLLKYARSSRADRFWLEIIGEVSREANQALADATEELTEILASSSALREAFRASHLSEIAKSPSAGEPVHEIVLRRSWASAEPTDTSLLPSLDSPPEQTVARRSLTIDDLVAIHEPNGLEVVLPEFADGWWLEVIRRSGETVSVVPVLPGGSGHRAVVLLPVNELPPSGTTTERLADLEFGLIRELPRPPASGIDAFADAIQAGRRALEAERLRQTDVAGDWWRTCAQRWAGLGDDRRADLARQYAGEVEFRAMSAQPLFSDAVAAHPTQR